jgi:Ferritin-like domain
MGRRAVLARALTGSIAPLGVDRAGWEAAARPSLGSRSMASRLGPGAVDIEMLQTQASLEALAVRAYQKALTLDALKTMPATAAVKVFATTTLAHHRSHLVLFNQTVEALGGSEQERPDPRYESQLESQLSHVAKMSDEAAVSALLGLAITLESVAAETYVKNSPTFTSAHARGATAGVSGIEAQHVAALRTLQAVVKTVPAAILSFGGDTAAALTAADGSVGFPDAFFPTGMASPADEGAVR